MKLDSALRSLALSNNLRHLALNSSSILFEPLNYKPNLNPNSLWKNLKVTPDLMSAENLELLIKPEVTEVLELECCLNHEYIFYRLDKLKKLKKLKLGHIFNAINSAEIASRVTLSSFPQLESIGWKSMVSVLKCFW